MAQNSVQQREYRLSISVIVVVVVSVIVVVSVVVVVVRRSGQNQSVAAKSIYPIGMDSL